MSGKAIRETVGLLAVVAGLAFVGLEVQQSNVQARAATSRFVADFEAEYDLGATP